VEKVRTEIEAVGVEPGIIMNEVRWEKLKSFIAEWHRPLTPGDGYSEEEIAEAEARLGIRFPETLREWYGFAGKWYYELQEHNRQYALPVLELTEFLIDPDEELDEEEQQRLRMRQGGLVFHVENQGVCEWAIHQEDFEVSDPPIYDDVNDAVYSPTLTEFLLTALIFETTCVAIEAATTGTATGALFPLLDTNFRCWHSSQTMGIFYGNAEAIVLVYEAETGDLSVDLSLRSIEFTDHYKALLASEVRWRE
jgi:hypothetical protein